MGVLELVVLGAVGVVAAVGAIGALVGRDRRRRNQVVPGTETGAPVSWAGSHTPEARLHRRLRSAVTAARSVDDPDGSLLSARVEVERAALATDRHLVALAAMHERESAGRMPAARAAVAAIESAAAALADVGGAGRNVIATRGPGQLPAVEAAMERTALLQQAIDELDEIDATVEPRRPRGSVVVSQQPAVAVGDGDDGEDDDGGDDGEVEVAGGTGGRVGEDDDGEAEDPRSQPG